MTDLNTLDTLGDVWAADAQKLVRDNQAKAQNIVLRYLVADFEYAYDDVGYAHYCAIEGEGAEPKMRWPFHRIVCGSWMMVTFDSLSATPQVEKLTTIGMQDVDEEGVVRALFDVLHADPHLRLVTWGGNYKDLPVLRCCALRYGLRLPSQLLDLRPYSDTRIDLCVAVSSAANNVHLGEYAASQGVPFKSVMPSKDIGWAVLNKKWSMVREVCEHDVLTTALLLGRYVASHYPVATEALACDQTIADAVISTHMHRDFVRDMLVPWRKGRENC